MNHDVKELVDFLDSSPSYFHAISNVANLLEQKGYRKLYEHEDWTLLPGGCYYMVRADSALIAFRIPQGEPTGFMLSASHCDRPGYKVKENGELVSAYTRIPTETYGGLLMGTWLDRPLSIAGRVVTETESGIESKLINIDKDLLLIPNVAIHMNREANNSFKWNPAVDTQPLLGTKEAAGKLEKLLEQEAGGRILGRDLYLYVRQKASVWGIEDEFISSAGLDDLECVWGCTQGFLNAKSCESIPVLCVLDSEEVGSQSPQGAGSRILEMTLQRICNALDLNMARMQAQSFMISADNAHALHPNHPELSDASNAPVVNGGVVLKFNANLSYCTSGLSSAVVRKLCDQVNVPVQTFFNRADTRGGSTLGHVSLTHVSIPTADIGLPQLAMHSCYETAGVKDIVWLKELMTAYYGTSLKVSGSSCDLV